MIELVFLGSDGMVVRHHCETLETGIVFACANRELSPLAFILPGAKYEPGRWLTWRQLVRDLRRHFPETQVRFPAYNFFLDGYSYHLHEIVGEYDLPSLQKVS
jgi:hypothetical protein